MNLGTANRGSMRVVLLNEFFGKGMGYLENMLPKFLSRLGVEVHVVATDLPALYQKPGAARTSTSFAEMLQPGTIETLDGYVLHVLGHKKLLGHMRMVGLREKLREIRPDIVQTTAAIGWIPFDAALFKPLLHYKLFTGSHYHASVFPLANQQTSAFSPARLKCLISRTVPGRLTNFASEKCYAITSDCAEIATKFFGVPHRQIEICPLGVDVELFHPVSNSDDTKERLALRQKLGFKEGDIVCVYTGRFTEDKNPALLARAVAHLRREGEPYRGLFVGNGMQADEIQKCEGCVTHPFVPVDQLGAFYRAAEIGMWPSQESLSMLDAAASGLPIIANHTMTAIERINGNGASYQLGDANDLMRVLLEMRDPQKREQLGKVGAQKMVREFSWLAIAKRRVSDYEAALFLRKRSITHSQNKLLQRTD
jgi:glycosyltransferase involved in cell wall biosynthesis